MWALGLTSDQETQNLVHGSDGGEGIETLELRILKSAAGISLTEKDV